MASKNLFFLFSILLSMVGTKASAYDIAVENNDGVIIFYNYINNGTELEVTYQASDYENKDSYIGDVVIPGEITIMNSTKKVASIGKNAFIYCSGMTSVTIPNSVRSIGWEAFSGCTSLTSVIIGNSVASIEFHAFYDCSSLTSVHVSDLESWCKIAFYPYSNPLFYANHLFLNGEEIKDLVIPNSVTSIGTRAFAGCNSLTSVTIPNSVLYIGEYAFELCIGLTSVTIPSSVTSIGNSAFEDCWRLTSIEIPSSVTSIENSAFANCSGLTSIEIPNSVTSIGYGSFWGCI